MLYLNPLVTSLVRVLLSTFRVPTHHKPRAGATVPSDRPPNVKPTPAGSVAIDGKPNLPLRHATLSDKIVGRTQKVRLLS